MTVLHDSQRSILERTVITARTVAEQGAADAITQLAVGGGLPAYFDISDTELRAALQDKATLLGDQLPALELPRLREDIAFEQWHRLLFARFLEANGLLMHPEHAIPVTLQECADLAMDEGEPDGWAVATRYAAQELPGVFRTGDPAVRVRLAPEHRQRLEDLVAEIDPEVLRTEDALGWVYQFWQTKQKETVNRSGRKIGGADISPVTQLFTENYMVRFLLENSLGAWWAARHPASALLANWDYLRILEDGAPAAGTFDEWPCLASGVTVMDPCCGSGHFLVSTFGMLWRMRAEEEGLDSVGAQDAVLRDNLFGLELDPRCTQIARFALILEAWKQGGFRTLPEPRIACSGIPAKRSIVEWQRQVGGDDQLTDTLARLHSQFSNADSLGSLIDPRRATVTTALFHEDGAVSAGDWNTVRSALDTALREEGRSESVTGAALLETATAATLLSDRYTLVVTNPPFRKRGDLVTELVDHLDAQYPVAKGNLATAFLARWLGSTSTLATVSPQDWMLLGTYEKFRRDLLEHHRFDIAARLGHGAFRSISGEVVKVALTIISQPRPASAKPLYGVLAQRVSGIKAKAIELRTGTLAVTDQATQLANPDARLTLTKVDASSLLLGSASSVQGIATGDLPRFGRCFWEVRLPDLNWSYLQSTVEQPQAWGGREYVVRWQGGCGPLSKSRQARIQGRKAWGRRGVTVSQMGSLAATLYDGELFDMNAAVILPNDEADLPAIWAYCSSAEFNESVREIDDVLKVTNATLVKVPFDRERWAAVAAQAGSLPEPYSDDPTQWLFGGSVASSTNPLQVAVARLVGYRWPDQEPDALDALRDNDGIVALPAVAGQESAVTRLRKVLSAAFGAGWSADRERDLVIAAGVASGDLDEWLRKNFFAQHAKLFHDRPFIWYVTDGFVGGFSALLDYHRLDHALLGKLIYAVLGSWIDKHQNDLELDPSAAIRLHAAQILKAKLVAIHEGHPPFDIYVRWKPLVQQSIGWYPDLDDGVRLNIRPFVEAQLLASKVNVHWKVDKGKDAGDSNRVNDLHPTLEERQAARGKQA